jgi:hypothetical protein
MLQESKIKFWGDKTTTETSKQTECAQIKWLDLGGKCKKTKGALCSKEANGS